MEYIIVYVRKNFECFHTKVVLNKLNLRALSITCVDWSKPIIILCRSNDLSVYSKGAKTDACIAKK